MLERTVTLATIFTKLLLYLNGYLLLLFYLYSSTKSIKIATINGKTATMLRRTVTIDSIFTKFLLWLFKCLLFSSFFPILSLSRFRFGLFSYFVMKTGLFQENKSCYYATKNGHCRFYFNKNCFYGIKIATMNTKTATMLLEIVSIANFSQKLQLLLI